MKTKYMVVIYNRCNGCFLESLSVYDLENAIKLLKGECNRIIDDFARGDIEMDVSMIGYGEAIRIYDVNNKFKNYYVVFVTPVKVEDD